VDFRPELDELARDVGCFVGSDAASDRMHDPPRCQWIMPVRHAGYSPSLNYLWWSLSVRRKTGNFALRILRFRAYLLTIATAGVELRSCEPNTKRAT
jgi:hypothetical protein